MKIIKKTRKKKPEKADRGRNEGRSEVYGISASREFWEYVTQKMREDGTNRSETIVNACVACWQKPELVSNPVGRPKGEDNA